MNSAIPKEYLYLYILQSYHGDNIHKNNRKKTVLFNNVPTTMKDIINEPENGWNPASARINQKNMKKIIALLSDEERINFIIKLITYLYIIPFLRLSVLVFLILFRFYHSVHPEIISARMNESFLIRSFWSNYYTNPRFLSQSNHFIPYYGVNQTIHPQIPDSLDKKMPETNSSINNTLPIPSITKSNTTIKYYNSSKLLLSNFRTQLVFTTHHTVNKLSQPAITSINNTMMLVDLSTPIHYFRANPHSLIKLDVQPKITPQITINKPKPNQLSESIKNKNNSKIGKKGKQTNKKQNIKNRNFKKNNMRGSVQNINSHIYGYIIVEKGIAVVYENDVPHIYKLSKAVLDKYLAA